MDAVRTGMSLKDHLEEESGQEREATQNSWVNESLNHDLPCPLFYLSKKKTVSSIYFPVRTYETWKDLCARHWGRDWMQCCVIG